MRAVALPELLSGTMLKSPEWYLFAHSRLGFLTSHIGISHIGEVVSEKLVCGHSGAHREPGGRPGNVTGQRPWTRRAGSDCGSQGGVRPDRRDSPESVAGETERESDRDREHERAREPEANT